MVRTPHVHSVYASNRNNKNHHHNKDILKLMLKITPGPCKRGPFCKAIPLETLIRSKGITGDEPSFPSIFV